MVRGPFEWGVAGAMVAVAATIGGWYAIEWSRSDDSGAVHVRHVLPAMKELPETPAPAIPVPLASRARSTAWYRFIAVRGDSWLQVRSGSRAGRVLFEGTLSRGTDLRFRTRPLWVRFGAATNLNLRIAGRASPLPQFGTFDAYVTRDGVHSDRVFHPDGHQATAAQSPYSDM